MMTIFIHQTYVALLTGCCRSELNLATEQQH